MSTAPGICKPLAINRLVSWKVKQRNRLTDWLVLDIHKSYGTRPPV
jgi:hypothetical protein